MEDGEQMGEPNTVGGRLKAAVIFETSPEEGGEVHREFLTTGVHPLGRSFWGSFCVGFCRPHL